MGKQLAFLFVLSLSCAPPDEPSKAAWLNGLVERADGGDVQSMRTLYLHHCYGSGGPGCVEWSDRYQGIERRYLESIAILSADGQSADAADRQRDALAYYDAALVLADIVRPGTTTEVYRLSLEVSRQLVKLDQWSEAERVAIRAAAVEASLASTESDVGTDARDLLALIQQSKPVQHTAR